MPIFRVVATSKGALCEEIEADSEDEAKAYFADDLHWSDLVDLDARPVAPSEIRKNTGRNTGRSTETLDDEKGGS